MFDEFTLMFWVSVCEPRPISSTTFAGSASPITDTSDASHCWKGLATRKPSDVNHRVNGAFKWYSCTLVDCFGDEDCDVTWAVTLYTGTCLSVWEDNRICSIVLDTGYMTDMEGQRVNLRALTFTAVYCALLNRPHPVCKCAIQEEVYYDSRSRVDFRCFPA